MLRKSNFMHAIQFYRFACLISFNSVTRLTRMDTSKTQNKWLSIANHDVSWTSCCIAFWEISLTSVNAAEVKQRISSDFKDFDRTYQTRIDATKDTVSETDLSEEPPHLAINPFVPFEHDYLY